MKRLSLILIALLASACSSSIDPVEPPSELTDFKAELQLQPLWSNSVGAGSGGKYIKLQPLLDGEQVVAADHFGSVRAYQAVSGELLWQVELGRTINSGIGHAEGLLLFGGDAELFAIDRNSGELRWSTPLNTEVLGSPVAHSDTVVVHALDGSISAFSRSDGRLLWRQLEKVPSLSLRGTGKPLILNGKLVVVGNAVGQVLALNLHSGELLWRTAIASASGRTDLERMIDVDAELVADSGIVYASAYQGFVAAIDAASGRLLWTREISSQSGIVLDERALYLSDSDSNVWALSRANGTTLWKQDKMLRRSLSVPAQQGRYLIIGDYDGYLHWINKVDGHLAARIRIRDFWDHFPVAPDEAVNEFKENRGILVTPLVEGARIYGFDQRGVLDAYSVSVIEATAE